MTTKTAVFKVIGHTPGTVKCVEVDANGEKTRELSGSLYIVKGVFGQVPIGSVFDVSVTLRG